MSDPKYTYDEDMGKEAFSIHEIVLHTDGVKVGEGWSLMLRQKSEDAYNQVEEEQFGQILTSFFPIVRIN